MDFSTQTQMKNRLVNKGLFQDLSKSLCVKTNYICPSFNDSTEGQRGVPAKQQQQKN